MGNAGADCALSEVLGFLAPNMRRLLVDAARHTAGGQADSGTWEEIRLRVGRPLTVVYSRGDFFVSPDGHPHVQTGRAYRVNATDLQRTVELMSGSSLYAWESELRQGFLTLPKGHRVGVCGRAVFRDGQLFTLKELSSLNLRIAREVPGAGDRILPWLIDASGYPYNTLIFSPPGAGKTTILRDLTRQLATGRPELGLEGLRVGVADERSELAGTWQGMPQKDIGPRADVLDGCPKALGITMLLRAMNPQVLVTDEIGRLEDVEAIKEALRCGVRILASAHAGSVGELTARPSLRELLGGIAFVRLVKLGRGRGTGTVEEIWDWRERSRIFPEAGRESPPVTKIPYRTASCGRTVIPMKNYEPPV